MIVAMPNCLSLKLETRILDLPNRGQSRIGPLTAKKLALGLAEVSPGKDINTVTLEDLLLNLPMRYEDRSSFARIADLEDGKRASLELFVRGAKPRYIGRQRFIFTVSASDRNNTGPQVLIEWFVSGQRAKQ